MINAHYDDEAGVVTRLGTIHMGVATQTDAGLMVPVIRAAQDLNIWQLAAEISRLSNSAREGTATQSELTGSTITLRSEEHTSELQSLMRISYAVFCLKKKNTPNNNRQPSNDNSTKMTHIQQTRQAA